jgi:hypothetical protein
MRISAGSRGLSRNGGNIHVHPEIPFITIRPTIKRPISQSIPLAPLEIRDAVFRELIKLSPASSYREELVTGPGRVAILPAYLRRTRSIEELLPWLYLKGLSTGYFSEALAALLGKGARGLSAATISRLKEIWKGEYEHWTKRDLSGKHILTDRIF